MYMSEPKLLSSGVYGCVYHPGYICSGAIDTRNNVTKLVMNDFTTQTEIEVGQKLKNIEGFVVVHDSCIIQPSILQKSGMVHQCELLKHGLDPREQYKLLHSPYIKSVELDEYLNKYATSDMVIRTYLRVCKLIIVMIHKRIVHNDLHFGNILVNNSNLYVIDYGLSIIMDKCYIGQNINYPYLKDLINKKIKHTKDCGLQMLLHLCQSHRMFCRFVRRDKLGRNFGQLSANFHQRIFLRCRF